MESPYKHPHSEIPLAAKEGRQKECEVHTAEK